MIFYLSKYILVGLVIFVCYTCLLPSTKISFRFVKSFWFLLIVSLAIFSYFAEPDETEDLYRYYVILSNFRKGASHLDLKNPYLPLFSQLLFSFSSLFENNGILPSLSVLIWGYFVGSILFDLFKKNKIKLQAYLICLIFLLGNGSVYNVICHIRNSLAFAVWAYGYYFFFYKDNKAKLFWLYTLIALLIHKSIFLLIIITIFYNFIIKKGSSKLIWVRTLICLFVLFVLLNTSMPAIFFDLIFLDFIGNSFLNYQNYSMNLNIGNLIRFFILLILLWLELLSSKKKNCNRISLPFFILMVSFVSISMPIFYERLTRLIAIIELPTIINFYNYKLSNTKQRFLFISILLPILGLNLFYNIYSLFSHFRFNGEFYQDIMKMLMLKF